MKYFTQQLTDNTHRTAAKFVRINYMPTSIANCIGMKIEMFIKQVKQIT